MVKSYHITTHQVSQLSADEIKKGFIVRKNLLNRTLTKINHTNRTDSIQHTVFVGPRGSGKSSMLNRIKVEYLESDRFIPIYLPEEQPGLYRLFDVWLAIIDEMMALGYDIHRPEIDTSQEEFSYLSKTGYTVISDFLQKENKQIILLMDNIDRVFKNIDDDKALLRELLQNHKDLIIIGGSTEMSEDFWDYGDPFYQFFKVVRLEDLSKAEVQDLLIHWSEVNDLPQIKDVLRTNPGKVEAIRQMTGGNPRTMIMFVRLLVDNAHAQGFEYLKDIIDKTTSIYQERLQQLAPQQRKIVVELASIWQPATVEQLVQTCLMSSSIISAQLNKLQKSRIVDALKPKKGKTVYRLKERMFNLYLIMTQAGALQKKRARYLTDFLEVWYDGEEIKDYYYKTIQEFGKVSGSNTLVRAKALAHSKYISAEERDHILDIVKESPAFYGTDTSMLPDKMVELMEKAKEMYDIKNYKSAIEILSSLEQQSGEIVYRIGLCYHENNNFRLAEKFYLDAINMGITDALNNYANVLTEENKFTEAENYYHLAIEEGNVNALNNYGKLLEKMDRISEAEEYFLKAIDKGVTIAFYNYAVVLEGLGKYQEAENNYLKAIEYNNKIALNNYANLLSTMNRKIEAEKYYLKAIELDDISAYYNYAILLVELNRKEEGEIFYLKAINKGHILAINNYANLLMDLNRKSEAEQYYLKAAEKGIISAFNNYAVLKYLSNNKIEAEEYFEKAFEKGHSKAFQNLIMFYYKENKKQEILNLIIKNKDQLNSTLLTNLTDLWLGNLDKYLTERDLLTLEEINDNPKFYIEESLVHFQYDWIIQLFEKFDDLKQRFSPLYFASNALVYNKIELEYVAPTFLLETVNDIVKYVKEKQEFYYGTSKNI